MALLSCAVGFIYGGKGSLEGIVISFFFSGKTGRRKESLGKHNVTCKYRIYIVFCLLCLYAPLFSLPLSQTVKTDG